MDADYERKQTIYELILQNGIKTDWCATEDKKRHVVASVPSVLPIMCPQCVRTHWKKAVRWFEMESKQFDVEVIHDLYFTKTAPAFLFFNKHTVACLPTEEDVSKYNTVADLGEKFDVITADNYYTFDRELYPVWDEFTFAGYNPEWTVE